MNKNINYPEISIIMATYNRSYLIKEALDSITTQSFENWECLIIDDGSDDGTYDIIKSYTNSDPRFRYYKRGIGYKKGLPGSRNKGLDLAKGNYIQFFDDDDIVHPENLKTSVNEIKKSGTYFCRCEKKPFTGSWQTNQYDVIDDFDRVVFRSENIDEMVTGKTPFASCTVLWDKRCFEKIRFNENLMYAEEWECYTRILSQGFTGVSINKILYFNRKHSDSNTGEFWNKDRNRVNSYENAALLIIDNLESNNHLNMDLKRFFIRLGFMLNSRKIIKNILNATQAGNFEKTKYLLGYKIYPLLKPVFFIKGKILRL